MKITTLLTCLVCALATAPGVVAAQARPLEAPNLEPAEAPRTSLLTVEPGELRPPGAGQDGPGWKIAFWITAAATVGLATGAGISAALLQEMDNEKLELITAYRRRTMDHYAFAGPDVCMEAEMRGDAGELVTWCEDGKSRFLTTYVLLGLTIAGTIATGALLYRAYFHRPSRSAAPEAEESGGVEHETLRFLIAPSIGPRGGSLGLVLRF